MNGSIKCGLLAGLLIVWTTAVAHAQLAHHPFAIGASEGVVGHQNALGAWILGQEGRFYRLLTAAVRATRDSAAATWALVGISLAYGVFHAAGPGHGKAVVASYMISNEVALRRGLVIAVLAALLQALVAIVLIGTAALVFHATAQRMTAATEIMEFASYLGIIALGLALVWRKGRALIAALRPAPATSSLILAGAASSMSLLDDPAFGTSSRFSVDDGSGPHIHDPDCGHFHMPSAESLTSAAFNWKVAAVTILTAGARPCSGAILVLVFALAQGVFWIGVAAAFAMAAGTAVTTGTLAIAAVFAKDLAVRLSGSGSRRSLIVGRLVEVGAAACVLAFGIALLTASLAGVPISE